MTRQLTSREETVLVAILIGTPLKAIALDMGLSINTVATYARRAYVKCGTTDRTVALRRFRRRHRQAAMSQRVSQKQSVDRPVSR